MKILTTKQQKQIEKNRDIIFKYIRSNPTNDVIGMGDAIEALADLSCECGVWSNPADIGKYI